MRYCKNCKKLFSDVVEVCPKCGERMIDIVEDKVKVSEDEKSKVVLNDYDYEDDFRDW